MAGDLPFGGGGDANVGRDGFGELLAVGEFAEGERLAGGGGADLAVFEMQGGAGGVPLPPGEVGEHLGGGGGDFGEVRGQVGGGWAARGAEGVGGGRGGPHP